MNIKETGLARALESHCAKQYVTPNVFLDII